LLRNDYAVRVERHAHRLTVTKDGRVVLRLRAGVGSARTPTPLGVFYVTESLRIAGAARGYYGPFALGLSGFSNVLFHFKPGAGSQAGSVSASCRARVAAYGSYFLRISSRRSRTSAASRSSRPLCAARAQSSPNSSSPSLGGSGWIGFALNMQARPASACRPIA